MLKKILKITFRNLVKQKGYSLINISGLAIGIACSLLALLYIQNELSYDQFHSNKNRIYRVSMKVSNADGNGVQAPVPTPLGPAIQENYPDAVKNIVRLNHYSSEQNKVIVSYKKNRFYEDNIYFASPNFLEVFDFPLIAGDPSTALKDPSSILLTEAMAKKYFGNEDPLNKILAFSNNFNFKVTGVLKNIPENSHLHFDFVFPLDPSTINEKFGGYDYINNWWDNIYTYVELSEDYNYNILDEQLPKLVIKYFGEELKGAGVKWEPFLQPITKIHLGLGFTSNSPISSELEENGNTSFLYLIGLLSLIVLIVAAINYTNLSTARSFLRNKEVGVKKCIGSSPFMIFKQFMFESLTLSFIALIIGLVLLETVLPWFNYITQKKLEINILSNPLILFSSIGFTIITSALAGTYPAFFMSRINPLSVLNGNSNSKISLGMLKKILVIVQFAISMTLIFTTLVIHQQRTFMQQHNLGFDKEQILVVRLHDIGLRIKAESIKEEIIKLPDIKSATVTQQLPGNNNSWGYGYNVEGFDIHDMKIVNTMYCDEDYLKTFDLKIIQGRNFSKDFKSDVAEGYLVNETAVKEWGWKDPIGKELREGMRNKKGRVIGVIKDYNYESLHQPIESQVLHYGPEWANQNICIKINSGNTEEIIKTIGKIVLSFNPNYPFDYFFLDQQVNKSYQQEKRLELIFTGLSCLAIFIACMGLWGTFSFSINQRSKEIGIRKVLGASPRELIILLSTDMFKLIVIAIAIGLPIGYYFMIEWLKNFPYQIPITFFYFIVPGIAILLLGLFVISFHVIKSLSLNPVKELKYE